MWKIECFKFAVFHRYSLSLLEPATYRLSQKVAPNTFCKIFTYGEPMQLKFFSAVAQQYSYMSTNFGQFV